MHAAAGGIVGTSNVAFCQITLAIVIIIIVILVEAVS